MCDASKVGSGVAVILRSGIEVTLGAYSATGVVWIAEVDFVLQILNVIEEQCLVKRLFIHCPLLRCLADQLVVFVAYFG